MMRSMLVLVAMLVVSACSDSAEPAGPPLIVYAPGDDPVDLVSLFEAFTADTGIPIAPVWGNSSSNTDSVIAKLGTPADVLITSNVADIVRAADKGALRPIDSQSLAKVANQFRDPDSLWVALGRHAVGIAISPMADAQTNADYAALATDAYRGKVCLSSVTNPFNQALIAWLIEDYELKPAERMVRGWIRNLAAPPFAGEEALLAALASGECHFGIVSAQAKPDGRTTRGLAPQYFDVSATGVGRHAQNPEHAQRFIAWLTVNHPIETLAEWDGRNVSIAGWRNEEARLLAERAGYN